jgi:hypothetical protein
MAEVISDEEFDTTVFGQAKVINNLGDDYDDPDGEEDGGGSEPNLLVRLTLRSLDVVFLVVERSILLIPDVLAVTNRVVTRFGEVNRDGTGQIGWRPLNTKIRGSRRY